jgi:S-adenosylmethionine:tRNA ribosyltransferase-isomerase
MQKRDFLYELPPELIAQTPLPERSASRLLALDGATGCILDYRFSDLVQLLHSGDLLVFNNTRVIPARLLGSKLTGGKVEVLIERVLDDAHVLAQVRANKPLKNDSCFWVEEAFEMQVVARRGEFFELRSIDSRPIGTLLQEYGRIPLPPYINRPVNREDSERYQTVYAKYAGAVAAPTAGLHFDSMLLKRLERRGIEFSFITLHVGAGTFQPVRVEDIQQHRMHAEYVQVNQPVCDAVFRCQQRGGRVVAVGTTTVRGLETAALEGELRPYMGETRLFISPGFRFKVVDVLITNFHLPVSTLLMLVSAFGGHPQVMNAYQHAVDQRYRFYSYGDAMWVTRCMAENGI